MNDDTNDVERKPPAKRTAAKRPAKRIGRPTVLDDAKQRDLCALIAIGCTRYVAAAYVGCSPTTIYYTAQRDPVFAAQLLKADHTCEVHALSLLNQVGKEQRNWRVLAWMLERKFPDRYGARKPASVAREQLAEVVERFAAVLAEEIPAGALRRRVLKRLSTAMDVLHDPTQPGESS